MRIFVFGILFTLLLYSQVISQNFNKAFQMHNDHVGCMAAVDNYHYFSTTVYDSVSDTCVVYSVSTTGQLKFRKKFVKGGRTEITRLIKTLDNKICYIGDASACDVISGSEVSFLMKLDSSGNTIFDNTFLNYGMSFSYMRDLCQSSDSSYYGISDSCLFHFSKNGNLIKKINTGKRDLTALFSISPTRLLINGKTGAMRYHYEIDTSANIINSAVTTNTVVKYGKLSSGTFIALNNNNYLEKLSPRLSSIATSSLTQGVNTQISDFVIDQDSIFACGKNSQQNTPVYIKFDSLLVNQYLNNPSHPNINPVAISLNNDNVGILSNGRNTIPPLVYHNFASIDQLKKQGGITLNKNVGVVSLVMDSIYIDTQISASPNFTNTLYFAHYRLKAIVKNYGNTSLSGYYLNHKDNYFPTCGYPYFHQWQSMIPPQGTTSITMPFIKVVANVFPGMPVSQNFTLNNLCAWTSLPENEADADITNDAQCISHVVAYVNSVKEEEQEKLQIDIFPNPFHDKFSVSMKKYFTGKIELFDVLGKKITEKNISGTEEEINTSELLPGLYLLRLTDRKNQSAFRKINKF